MAANTCRNKPAKVTGRAKTVLQDTGGVSPGPRPNGRLMAHGTYDNEPSRKQSDDPRFSPRRPECSRGFSGGKTAEPAPVFAGRKKNDFDKRYAGDEDLSKGRMGGGFHACHVADRGIASGA